MEKQPPDKPATPPRPILFPPFAPPAEPIRPGSLCPKCGEGVMDYNGLLELECIKCGYVISGGGGCT